MQLVGNEQQDVGLYEPDVPVEGTGLYAPDTIPSVVPPNSQELAGILASADIEDADMGKAFEQRYADVLGELQRNGVAKPLEQAAVVERQDTEAGLRANAEEQARLQNPVTLEAAGRLIQQHRERMATPPSTTEGLKAAASRALENQAMKYAQRLFDNAERAASKVDEAAGENTLRNILAIELQKLDFTSSTWDEVKNFLGSVLFGPVYTYQANRAYMDAVGERGIASPLTSMDSVRQLRTALLGMEPEQQREVVKGLVKQFENPAEAIDVLSKLLSDPTPGGAVLEGLGNMASAFDVLAVKAAASALVRKGAPLVAIAKTAGDQAAAQVAIADLIRGTKIGGLNDSELMARVLSVGADPFSKDPAALAGLSGQAQKQLSEAWDKLRASTADRLASSGLTPEEVKAGLAEIRANYSAEVNKAIHHVIFGEGDDLGQRMTVLWQGPDGRAFATKEAAEAWAKAEGKVAYEIVPRNEAQFRPSLGRVVNLDDARLKRMRSEVKAVLKGLDAESFEILQNDIYSNAENKTLIPSVLRDDFRTWLRENYTVVERETAQAIENLRETEQQFLQNILDNQSDYSKSQIAFAETLLNKGDVGPKLRRSISLDDVDSFLDDNPDQVVGKAKPIKFSNTRHFSDGVDESTRGLVDNWKKQLGIDSDMAVVTRSDLTKNKGAYDAIFGKGFSDEILSQTDVHGGHIKLNGKHVVYLNDNAVKVGSPNWVQTVAHELGHAFDDEFLAKGMKDQRKMLLEEYSRWRQAKKGDVVGFVKGTNTPHILQEWADAIAAGKKMSFKELKRLDPNTAQWLDNFDEWWAEQFARFMLTDARPKSAIEQFFYKAAQALKKFYEGVVAQFGTVARDPNELVRKLLSEHLDNVKVMKEFEQSFLDTQSQLRYKKGEKPHIKLKLKEDVPSEGDGWLVREQRTDPLSLANVGKFSQKDIESMPWIAVDPKHGASELAVEERVIGVHAEAKLRKDLSSHLAPFFDKLSATQKQKVQEVLRKGDSFSDLGKSTGREFNYAELKAMGLNDDEAMAYFAARQVRMMSYHVRNAEMVRSLRSKGYKEVEIVGTGERVAGRVLERDAAASTHGTYAYDTVKGEQVLVDSDVLDAAYAAGKKVVRVDSPIVVGGGKRFTLIVDDTTAKARDIVTAIHYRPGEFSRIYSDQYFITLKSMQTVDGVAKEVVETVRTAASVREAKEYVEAHNKAMNLLIDSTTGKAVPRNLEAEVEKLIGQYTDAQDFIRRFREGETDGFISLDWHFTRNREEYLNGSINEAVANGRLFTSKRSDRLFSVDRDRRNTLDVFDSLEAEITNVSRVANIGQWRDSMIQRWMNTFGDLIPNRTGNDIADFFTAAGAKFTRGTPDAMFAERTHRYIMRQIGIRTQEERYWEGVTRSITEKFFAGSEPIESVGAWIRQKSALGFIRNINFNLNLGMFNPAQLLVQANGAASALILSPLHGLSAAKTFPLLRMALMSDNPDVWRKLARVEKLSSLGLGSEEEFVKLVKAIRTTGILDNMKSTALFNAEDGALNIFSGYPRRAAANHTFFFNRGEEFSRTVSFDVARREWMAANPGGDWTSKEALKHIVVRMDDLTQNMTKANLARWQEGVLSIPLQFAQYNIKLAANVMTAVVKGGQGRGFSRAEASALMAGHIALYGAAGNGLMWLYEEFMPNEMKDKMSPEQKNLLAQGAVSWAVDLVSQLATGQEAKVALGSRLGAFDYYQKLGEAIFKDPKNVYEALLGPTVSSAKRIGVIGEVASLWWRDPDLTGGEIIEGLGKMSTEQVASLRNAAKAYLFLQHGKKMVDSKGVPMGTLTSPEILAQALGFVPTMSQDVHNMIQSKKDHNQALDDIAATIFKLQNDMILAYKNGDKAKAEQKQKSINALWPENAGDALEVQRRIKERLFPYDTEFQKLLGDYMMRGHTYDKALIVNEQPRKQDGK